MNKITTLDEFILQKQKDFPTATGELSGLLRDIGLASKIINKDVNKAGLVNILGVHGVANASGDDVQKLDMYANDVLIDCLKNSGECCGIASEENESFMPIPTMESKNAKYVVVFDPLDGSSNIDVNISIGTIFGIYKRVSDPSGPCKLEDFLQNGNQLVAAGYVLFGTSTIMVYSTGQGVNGFTLDPSIGEFCLSHEDIKVPDTSKIYSVNQGYYNVFEDKVKTYIDACMEKKMRQRYVGSMVADVHRTLLKGGTFLYPGLEGFPKGKLRIVYECNPLSFVMEQAGGVAVNTEMERILDLEVKELHQRETVFMGSTSMIEDARSIFANEGNA